MPDKQTKKLLYKKSLHKISPRKKYLRKKAEKSPDKVSLHKLSLHKLFKYDIFNMHSEEIITENSKKSISRLYSKAKKIEIFECVKKNLYEITTNNTGHKLGFSKKIVRRFFKSYIENEQCTTISKIMTTPIIYNKLRMPLCAELDLYDPESFFDFKLESTLQKKCIVHINWSHLNNCNLLVECECYNNSPYNNYITAMLKNEPILFGEFNTIEDMVHTEICTIDMINDNKWSQSTESTSSDKLNEYYIIETVFHNIREIVCNNSSKNGIINNTDNTSTTSTSIITLKNNTYTKFQKLSKKFKQIHSYIKWRVSVINDPRFTNEHNLTNYDWLNNLLEEIENYYE